MLRLDYGDHLRFGKEGTQVRIYRPKKSMGKTEPHLARSSVLSSFCLERREDAKRIFGWRTSVP